MTAELDRAVTLRDGVIYRLRFLHTGDVGCLQDFFYTHTPDTIHSRYGYMLKEMTPQRALELVGVDQERDPALGIFSGPPDKEFLHAVGRYCLDSDGRSAELAFVVGENKRGLGMATVLLQELTKLASDHGLRKLWASVAPENVPMLSIFRKHHFRGKREASSGNLRLEKNLPAKPRPPGR